MSHMIIEYQRWQNNIKLINTFFTYVKKTSVKKNTPLKVELLKQFLYSSINEKVQTLKCTQ